MVCGCWLCRSSSESGGCDGLREGGCVAVNHGKSCEVRGGSWVGGVVWVSSSALSGCLVQGSALCGGPCARVIHSPSSLHPSHQTWWISSLLLPQEGRRVVKTAPVAHASSCLITCALWLFCILLLKETFVQVQALWQRSQVPACLTRSQAEFL